MGPAGLIPVVLLSRLFVTPESYVEGDYSTYVVVNGTATAHYSADNPVALVHANTEVVTFLLQATPPLRHRPVASSSNDTSVCTTNTTGPAKVNPIGGRALRLFVRTNCVATRPGFARITVKVPVVDGSPPVAFAFRKRCAGDDVAVPGLDVSIGAFVDGGGRAALVVHNGRAVPAYDAKDPSARVTYDTTDMHMYITMANVSSSPSQKFLQPLAEARQPWLKVLLSGPGARGGTATSLPVPLVFKFDCSGSGATPVAVTLPIADRQEPVRFGFVKDCRAGRIPGFDVTLSAYEPGVRGTYAVKNGDATSAYHPPRSADLPLAVVREAQFRTSFYLQMSTFNSLEFEPPTARSSDAFCVVSLGGDAATGGWVDDISSQLVINFNCIDSGTAVITITIPVQVQEQMLNATFAFRKECRWTATPGFDITLGAYIKSERGTYAVRNGAPTSAYSLWDPKAVVRAQQYSSIFYLQMSTQDEQEFDWPTVESSESFCKVTLQGPAARGGKARPAAVKALPLIAKYNCVKSGMAVVTITVPLGPWNEAAFSYRKACEVGEIPGFDVTLGAWVPGDRASYAVKNGAPTDAYDPAEHVAIIRSGTPSYTFYLMNTGESSLAVDQPMVQVANPAVAVNVSGDALEPGPLDQQARSLVLDFSCAGRAKSDVIVHLRVGISTVAFGFRKVRRLSR